MLLTSRVSFLNLVYWLIYILLNSIFRSVIAHSLGTLPLLLYFSILSLYLPRKLWEIFPVSLISCLPRKPRETEREWKGTSSPHPCLHSSVLLVSRFRPVHIFLLPSPNHFYHLEKVSELYPRIVVEFHAGYGVMLIIRELVHVGEYGHVWRTSLKTDSFSWFWKGPLPPLIALCFTSFSSVAASFAPSQYDPRNLNFLGFI